MIKFTLDINDILAFNKYYAKKNGTFIQKYIHWAFFIILAFIIGLNLYTQKASLPSYLIIIPFLVVVASIQMAFTNYLRRRSLINYIKQNQGIIGAREYSFNDTDLTIKVNDVASNYPFASILKLEESKLHYYAYTTPQSAVIIPKRLLAQGDEAKQLIDKIRSNIRFTL
ncbi:MAG: YcxB family protein [Paludibacteraceae bacterium]|nr:YcxB family protein [Paludibacteraceae bacterium]